MGLKSYLRVAESKYTVKELLLWLWRAWKGNHLQAILNASIGLLEVGVSLSMVWGVQHAVDVAAGHVEGSIYMAVGFMGLLYLIDFALHISSIWIRNILGIKAQNRMQQRMLDRILRSEWHGKEARHSGDVLNRLELDVNNVINFLTEVIPNTLSTLTMFLGAFFYLFFMDKVLSLIIVAMIPVFILLSRVYMLYCSAGCTCARCANSRAMCAPPTVRCRVCSPRPYRTACSSRPWRATTRW